MGMTLEQLSSKVLDQPTKNRAFLAKQLLDSLEPGIEPSDENEKIWAQEANRRFQEIAEGKMVTKPANEVMRAVRDRFKG